VYEHVFAIYFKLFLMNAKKWHDPEGSYDNSNFSFMRKHHIVFQSSCVTLPSYKHSTTVPMSPHPQHHTNFFEQRKFILFYLTFFFVFYF
jgi:hypothetical protein